MRITRVEGGIRAIDEADESVRVGTDGWRPATSPSITETLAELTVGPDEPDRSRTGVTEGLSVPGTVVVFSLDDDSQQTIGPREQARELAAGSYLLRWETPVRLFVTFTGPATVSAAVHEPVELRFPEPTAVSLGFERISPTSRETLTVPRTPAGVAAAIERFAGVTDNYTPDRSWPTQRSRPPDVSFDPAATLSPDGPAVPDTDVSLTVPPRIDRLLTAAPLVYYLGAGVELSEDDPALRVGDRRVGIRPETFHERVRNLLERCFYLDCATRTVGPHGFDTGAAEAIDRLELDAERLYDASIAERVRTYLDADFERVRALFPEWHLAFHVDPQIGHAPTLSAVVDDVPMVHLAGDGPDESAPSAGERDGTAGGTTCGSDSTGGTTGTASIGRAGPADGTGPADGSGPADGPERGGGTSESPPTGQLGGDVSLVEPPSVAGRLQGWLADGVPTEGFEAMPAGYDHRRATLGDPSAASVVAVLNGGATRREHERVADYYRDRAARTNIDPSVRTELTVAELARLFESSVGLVHFVGHRDERGLQCRDGFLDVASIDSVNLETFFLNACGSYPEGRALIRKGGVAGGVTVQRVLDEEAATVGIAFARAIVEGYSVARALSLASRPALSPSDYVVVGDGAYMLAREMLGPADCRILSRRDDGFRLVTVGGEPTQAGAVVLSDFEFVSESPHLSGQRREYEFTREELLTELPTWDHPVLFEGNLWWPQELHDSLADEA